MSQYEGVSVAPGRKKLRIPGIPNSLLTFW
jgi:hypothetical protein